MKKFLLGFALFGWLALTFGSPAQAKSKIQYRDPVKKSKEGIPLVTETSGTIKSESPVQVVLESSTGKDRVIKAADIVDIYYEVKSPDVRKSYGRAHSAETITAVSKTSSPAVKRDALKTALTEYQKLVLQVAGTPFVEREFQYRVAYLTTELAGDNKAQRQEAVNLLEKFTKAHSGGWQIVPAIRSLAQLSMDMGAFDKAAAAWDNLKKVPGIPEEMKLECDLNAIDALTRGKKAAEAEARLNTVLATLPKNSPQHKILTRKLIAIKSTLPGKLDEALKLLRQERDAAKTPAEIAAGYNALGEVCRSNGKVRDAMWEFLYVDLIFNQDKAQHKIAVTQLVQVFKELGDAAKSKEYEEKLKTLP